MTVSNCGDCYGFDDGELAAAGIVDVAAARRPLNFIHAAVDGCDFYVMVARQLVSPQSVR